MATPHILGSYRGAEIEKGKKKILMV